MINEDIASGTFEQDTVEGGHVMEMLLRAVGDSRDGDKHRETLPRGGKLVKRR